MNDPKISANGGNVTASGGNAGPHGKGGDFTMIGGSITGGAGGSVFPDPPAPSAPPKRWWLRMAENLVVRVVAALIVLIISLYLGLR